MSQYEQPVLAKDDHTDAYVVTYLLGYFRKMSLMTTMASCTT